VKPSFRATTIDDLDSIRAFLGEIFEVGSDAPFLSPAMLNWKYWEQRGDWSGPRGYVLEQDGKIAAHAGLWPLSVGTGPDSLHGAQLIDWGASRKSSGAGISLLMKVIRKFDFMIGIGGTEATRKILPAFGFKTLQKMWKGARPVRPLSQVLTHQERNWKLPLRFLRNSFWASQPSTSPFRQWTAREIAPHEISSAIYAAASSESVFTPRPPAFFDYLLRCPEVPFHLYGIFDQQGARGHFAISLVRGQARIAGVWLIEPTAEAWATAYSLAMTTLRTIPGAKEILTAGCDAMSKQGAALAGFRIVEGAEISLLDEKNRLSLPSDFQLQLGDDDAAFLDTGRPTYVT
jgi:hypothetical protein